MYSLIPLNIKVKKLLRYINLNKIEAVMSQIHSHQTIHTIIDISNLFRGSPSNARSVSYFTRYTKACDKTGSEGR